MSANASKLKSSGNGGGKDKKQSEPAQKQPKKPKERGFADRLRFELTRMKINDEKHQLNTKSIVSPSPPSQIQLSEQVIRNAVRDSMLGGRKELKVRLAFMLTNSTSGAATAQAFAFPCQPSLTTEFALFQGLFDEYKCITAESFTAMQFLQSNTGSIQWAIAYDPLSNTAYTAIADVLVAAKHKGPFNSPSPTTNHQWPSTDQTVSSHNGFIVFKSKMFTGPQTADPVGSATTGGEWIDTTNTTAIWGYHKGYVTAPVGGTTVVYGQMVLEVVFRVRS